MFALNSPVIAALSRELDFCALRHQIYAANVANVDSKNYQRLEVVRSSMASDVTPQGSMVGQIVSTTDSVRLDQELASLTRNALRYQTLLSVYQQNAGILNLAVKEGRGG